MTGVPVEFHQAKPGDEEILVALEEALFPEDPWTWGMIADELASPFSTYYLAALPDGPDLQVVGYGGVKVVGDGADIMTIGVFPRLRGQGLGKQILDLLVSCAREAGADYVFLEVRESNEAARRLYERSGFIVLDRVRGYFKNPFEDGIAMRLDLTN